MALTARYRLLSVVAYPYNSGLEDGIGEDVPVGELGDNFMLLGGHCELLRAEEDGDRTVIMRGPDVWLSVDGEAMGSTRSGNLERFSCRKRDGSGVAESWEFLL